MNFINCPKPLFNSSEFCLETKNFVKNNKNCGYKIGSFILTDPNFWEANEFNEENLLQQNREMPISLKVKVF